MKLIYLSLALFLVINNPAFAENENLTTKDLVDIELKKKGLELQQESENFKIILGVFTALIGGATTLWGILRYRRDEFLKKQAIFFELAKEYDGSANMYVAKRILDGFSFTYNQKRGFVSTHDGEFSKSNLPTTLRKKEGSKIPLSEGEIKIRESFDTLFDFFHKLYYLKTMKLLSNVEMDYFKYFIRKTLENQACSDFWTYSPEWQVVFTYFRDLK